MPVPFRVFPIARAWYVLIGMAGAAVFWSAAALAADGGACAREALRARPAIAATLATIGLQQNEAMGGATIAANGGLVRTGSAEAERDHAPDSEEAAWQRVWDYWRAVPIVYARDFAWMEGFASTARQRVAMIDHPWSAVFISWVLRTAGLTDTQFAFSALHSDYVRAAFAATDAEVDGEPTPYAYRACDIETTVPRVGDLLCFARDRDSHLDTFDRLRAAIRERALAMHCELVVARDARGVDAVGGNVVNTVTRRRLRLARGGDGPIAPDYLGAAHRWQRAARLLDLDAGAPALAPTWLSQQPWSVVLQLRAEAFAQPATAPAPPAPPPDPSIYRN